MPPAAPAVPVPTAAQFAAAIEAANEEKARLAAEKAEKELAEWTAKWPALVDGIRAKITKRLNKDHPNGKELKVTLGGDEMRLIHEHCIRGVAPIGLNIEEIKVNFLMSTGKNLAGVQFLPDTSNA